jgi:hypothetical protein
MEVGIDQRLQSCTAYDKNILGNNIPDLNPLWKSIDAVVSSSYHDHPHDSSANNVVSHGTPTAACVRSELWSFVDSWAGGIKFRRSEPAFGAKFGK